MMMRLFASVVAVTVGLTACSGAGESAMTLEQFENDPYALVAESDCLKELRVLYFEGQSLVSDVEFGRNHPFVWRTEEGYRFESFIDWQPADAQRRFVEFECSVTVERADDRVGTRVTELQAVVSQ